MKMKAERKWNNNILMAIFRNRRRENISYHDEEMRKSTSKWKWKSTKSTTIENEEMAIWKLKKTTTTPTHQSSKMLPFRIWSLENEMRNQAYLPRRRKINREAENRRPLGIGWLRRRNRNTEEIEGKPFLKSAEIINNNLRQCLASAQ